MEEIIFTEIPDLHSPYLIIGFEGWPNAAEVSSFSIQYLIDNLGAKKLASISNESFYQISSLRPVAVIKEGRLTELKFHGNHFYYSKDLLSKDLIFFLGVEPHLQWSRFVDLLFQVVEKFGVLEIVTVGGSYDYIPHTYPPKVSALYNQNELKKKIIHTGIELTDYTGPISIHTFILEAAREKGVRAISLWGHAPQYLQTKNIIVAYAVLKKLVDWFEIELDLTELERASDYFNQQVNQLVEQGPKLQEVIKKLEEVYKDSDIHVTQPGKKESKEEKVIYIQAFLKKPEDEGKKES
jgi:proteasome assembly chaperone (PAC2) family protein